MFLALPNLIFFTSKQGIFLWNDLLSCFEEDAKGFPEIRTGDFQIKKLALNLLTRKTVSKLEKILTLLSILYICECYFQVCSILKEN